jgi:hypothetical protein
MTEPARRRRSAPESPLPAPGPTHADPWGLSTPGEPLDAPPAPRNLSRREAAREQAAADATVAAAGIVAPATRARGDAPPSPFGALPDPGPGFGRITERVFNLPDPEREYAALELALQLGTNAADSIAAALDAAEDNARRAHRLFVCARVDAERFSLDADVIDAAMRTQAVAELQREKDSGLRTKAITEGDTAAKVAAMFPDEYRDLAERRIKSRKMVEHLEAFAGLWRSRCYSLATMLQSRRLDSYRLTVRPAERTAVATINQQDTS